MLRSRSLPILLVLVLATFVAAGCGGAGADAGGVSATPTPNPDGTPVANPANPADPTAAAGGATPTAGAPATIPDVSGEDMQGGLGGVNAKGDLFDPQAVFEDFATTDANDFNAATDDPQNTQTSDTPAAEEKTTYGPATFLLNDESFKVVKGTAFPKDPQIFQVTAINADSVELDLLAGEFSTGSSGVTIDVGETITLVNQDEGTEYKLKLQRIAKNTTSSSSSTGNCGQAVCF